jgi:hypothetical protein
MRPFGKSNLAEGIFRLKIFIALQKQSMRGHKRASGVGSALGNQKDRPMPSEPFARSTWLESRPSPAAPDQTDGDRGEQEGDDFRNATQTLLADPSRETLGVAKSESN